MKITAQELDELADWHATFPGRTASEVCDLLEKRERKGQREGLLEAARICRRNADTLAPLGFASRVLKDSSKAIEAAAAKLKP